MIEKGGVGAIKAAVRPVGAAPATRTLWTVQALRGAAALMVVIGHGQSAAAGIVTAAGGYFARSTLLPWGAGVDLFFILSGFIMVHASARLFGQRNARAEFLRRRLVRIVPLYWLVTTLFLALLAAATMKGGDPFPDAGAILASYAFFPADTYGDERLFPVFDLGWTLNYEMFFYALFALVVVLPRRAALATVGGLLLALVGIGTIVPGPSALWFWTRPIILDFGLGLAVGALTGRGVTLPPIGRILLAAVGAAMLFADPFHIFDGAAGVTVANDWPRVLCAGFPIAMLLAAAVLGPEPGMPRAMLPAALVGDASYSLYLVHPFALILTEKLAQKLVFVRMAQGWQLVGFMVVVALVLAFAVHRWIERPMTAHLARRVVRGSPSLPRRVAVHSGE
ncbi:MULTISPECIES: acyltransferase family protein [Sphingomonas]|uniref:Acyltransferase n=1 Tax=Sphingomonas zeae TaxID=1646122 RepID=A0A7Y6B7N1_9SPHN|nr:MULTISPECIES: acyltransferase [Sphingomonas]MBB4048641.1 peptidoglycan/LPS O-acetylase OafA/YrhL [Sphingomonas zeae]MDK8186465.1 acyltransferase [Sphingomonas zeae]MDK8216124.1 acyltransferase [Sphingomonas sp. UMB7805-LC452B]NUU47927.1 acyltransferase [Sphingomonas zeae]